MLCNTIVHKHMHTDISSSYIWSVLGLDFSCVCVTLLTPVYLCQG